MSNVDIDGGTIDGVIIGADSAASSTFTGVTVSSQVQGTTGSGYLDLGGDSGATAKLRVTNSGEVRLNDTTDNSMMTVGMTINQGANDDEALALKSSDVGHGRISFGETDTYFSIKKHSDTLGGARLTVLAEDAALASPLMFYVMGGTANTTKGTGGRGLIEFLAQEHDGSNNAANVTADGNIFAIRAEVGGDQNTRWLVDEDGDTWQAGMLSVGSHAQSDSPSTGSVVTPGGVGIGGNLNADGDASVAGDVSVGQVLSVGGENLSSGAHVVEVADEILDLAATSTPAVVVPSLLGGPDDFNALLVSVVIRRSDDETRNQRDLFWVTSQGTHGTVTTVSTQQGTGGGVSYSLSFSGNDLILTHYEAGEEIDAAISVQGLAGVTP